jgi:REP element-mobilizing transposase RayT
LHCYNRGIEKQQIFCDHDFYALFLSLVETYHLRDELQILAYCLMPNHFHFLIRQLKALAVSKFMEKVCGEYAKTFNHTFQRVGHLFQRRYGVKWVWRRSDLPLLVDYLHQNPVKGGLVELPEDWEYSSCREYSCLRPAGFLELLDVQKMGGVERDFASILKKGGNVERWLPSRSCFRE